MKMYTRLPGLKDQGGLAELAQEQSWGEVKSAFHKELCWTPAGGEVWCNVFD